MEGIIRHVISAIPRAAVSTGHKVDPTRSRYYAAETNS